MRELTFDEMCAVSGGDFGASALLVIAVIGILVLPGCAGGPTVNVEAKIKADPPVLPPIDAEIKVNVTPQPPKEPVPGTGFPTGPKL